MKHQCRIEAATERGEQRHARAMWEAAQIAPKAEPCRGCPAAYTYVDQDGDRVCSCCRLVLERAA